MLREVTAEPAHPEIRLRDAFAAYLRTDRWDVQAFTRAEVGLGDAACAWLGERLSAEPNWGRYGGALDGIWPTTSPPSDPGVVRIVGGVWVLCQPRNRVEAIDLLLRHDGAALRSIRARLGAGAPLEQQELESPRFRLPDDDSDWTYVYEQTFEG